MNETRISGLDRLDRDIYKADKEDNMDGADALPKAHSQNGIGFENEIDHGKDADENTLHGLKGGLIH